jgi:hypothetical protein
MEKYGFLTVTWSYLRGYVLVHIADVSQVILNQVIVVTKLLSVILLNISGGMG